MHTTVIDTFNLASNKIDDIDTELRRLNLYIDENMVEKITHEVSMSVRNQLKKGQLEA